MARLGRCVASMNASSPFSRSRASWSILASDARARPRPRRCLAHRSLGPRRRRHRCLRAAAEPRRARAMAALSRRRCALAVSRRPRAGAHLALALCRCRGSSLGIRRQSLRLAIPDGARFSRRSPLQLEPHRRPCRLRREPRLRARHRCREHRATARRDRIGPQRFRARRDRESWSKHRRRSGATSSSATGH